MSNHIHTQDDGRGNRRVLLNGKEVKNVIYADTEKGVVRFYPEPITLSGGCEEILTKELIGTVIVESMN